MTKRSNKLPQITKNISSNASNEDHIDIPGGYSWFQAATADSKQPQLIQVGNSWRGRLYRWRVLQASISPSQQQHCWTMARGVSKLVVIYYLIFCRRLFKKIRHSSYFHIFRHKPELNLPFLRWQLKLFNYLQFVTVTEFKIKKRIVKMAAWCWWQHRTGKQYPCPRFTLLNICFWDIEGNFPG